MTKLVPDFIVKIVAAAKLLRRRAEVLMRLNEGLRAISLYRVTDSRGLIYAVQWLTPDGTSFALVRIL